METPQKPRKKRRNTVQEGEKIVANSISLPPDLLARAKKKAKDSDRSFSNYVKQLIAKDLKENPLPEQE